MDPNVNELKKFINILEKDGSMQAKTRGANTPDEIIQIAKSAGYNISMKQLRFWSKELKAPYFPWSEKGDQWRRNFFS